MSKNINIAVIGLGQIGSYVYNELNIKKKDIEIKTGKKIKVVGISAKNKNKKRKFKINKKIFYSNPLDILKIKNLHIIIEAIGLSDGISKKVIETALKNKIHVITPNKALISKHGDKLGELAEKNKVNLEFEASVAGGIPIIRTIKEGLATNKITKVYGILNGTCNYILSEMEKTKDSFDSVLKKAQNLGYAEPGNPKLDLNGYDALAKIKAIHIEPAALPLVPINTLANMWATINHTYTNSYLRQTAADNLCQSAMSAFTAQGSPRELTQQELTQMFALSNGIAPSHGIELAHTDTNNQIQSKMMLAEQYGLASQHCFYQLLTTESLQQAMAEVLATPAKNQLPTLILHGQADGTVAINHASRAYYHQNQSSDQANPNMRYIEIDHAQHFDAFLPYPGFNDRFVPMHPYFEQALERMYNHLMFGQALPPSQRIATMPRGNVQGAVPELSDLHIPPIIDQPTHPIRVIQNQLVIE